MSGDIYCRLNTNVRGRSRAAGLHLTGTLGHRNRYESCQNKSPSPSPVPLLLVAAAERCSTAVAIHLGRICRVAASSQRPFTVVIGSLRDSLVRIPNPLSLYTINAQCSRTFGIDILGYIQEMEKTIVGFSCTLPPHRSLGLGNVITRFTIGCANCFCALRCGLLSTA